MSASHRFPTAPAGRLPAPRSWALATCLVVLGGAPPASLADGARVTPVGAVRVRAEFLENTDFDRQTADRRRYFAQRTRVGAAATINPRVEARLVAQDSRYWGSERPGSGTGDLQLELLEGFIDLRWIWDLPLEVRLGRQPLAYGRQRLLGDDEWSASGRRFDAYRIRFGLGGFFFDGFSAKLADLNVPAASGLSDRDRNLSGIYFAKEGDRLEQLDLYWLRDIDKRPLDSIKTHTLGILGRYALTNAVSAEVEFAHQLGEQTGTTELNAHMLAAALAWRLDRRTRLRCGFDWASGDDAPADETDGTFRPLFPSPHPHLGALDLVGRRNVQDLWGSASHKFPKGVEARLAAHWLRRDALMDGLYNRDGFLYPIDLGSAARGIAVEIDAAAAFEWIEGTELTLGYSHARPGEALTGQDLSDDAQFLYCELGISF